MSAPSLFSSTPFGLTTNVSPAPVSSTRSPNSSDVSWPIGQTWVNTVAALEFTLVSVANGTATWQQASSTASNVNTLTASSGGALSPSGNNLSIVGTANQVTTTGAGSTITISIPTTFIAPGSIASTTTITAGTGLTVTSGGATISAGGLTVTAGGAAITGNVAVTGSVTASTTLTATLGAITATNGNFVFGTAGNKLVYSSVGTTTAAGANSAGTVPLVAGTATVATTAVTANSLIQLTCQALGTVTVPSALAVTTKTAGTSFVILASQVTDTSTIFWRIIN